MPATLTYSPLPPQNSADFMRTNPRRYAQYLEICPIYPLTGIWTTHRTSLGYRYVSPNREPLPLQIEWSPTATPKIVHCFTFSAKEKDSETGLSYFGSRYYSSDLSVWLSVDPQSDKYPSLSPYTYCANNPVKLVDPNGEEVWIIGNEDNVNTVISSLNSYFENITVKCDKYGQLTIESGNPLTDDEKAFAEALADTKIQVNLQLGYSQKTGFKTPAGEDVESEGAGAFLGNDILYYDGRQEKDNIRKVRTLQYLSTDAMKRLYKEKDWGMLINHEITESYRGGIISSETNIPGRDKNGVINSLIKNKAHLEATPQPYTIGASWLHH